MANKSFVVQYIIKARDRYSAKAKAVAMNTRTMRDNIKAAAKDFSEFSKKTRRAGAVMTAALTAPIAYLTNNLKNAARDAGETESKFATVFRNIGGQADIVAVNLAKNYGLASTKSKQLLADTGDLLSGFGFSQESALQLSEQVNKLAVDLASFTNYSGGAEGASQALTKALLGERESLKSLGVAISEKDVKAKIATMVAEGQRFASLRQAKAQATLAIAIDQSKNAIGDFARTQQDLANQERITDSAIQNMKESFGKVLLPIALKVTQAIRKIAEYLTALSPAAKKTIFIIAAIAAVIGPLLIVLGSVAMVIPVITAGFTAFAAVMGGIGTVIGLILSPIGLVVAALVGGAVLIVKNWEKVKAFFVDILAFIKDKFVAGFAKVTALVDKFKAAKESIFGKVEEIRASVFGESPTQLATTNRVDVGVRVGLDKGLSPTGPASVAGMGVRRTDVGFATGG